MLLDIIEEVLRGRHGVLLLLKERLERKMGVRQKKGFNR